jgi:hypothetical protein
VEVNGSCKHSSLLHYGNNFGNKKFYSTGPWGIDYKLFMIMIVVVSQEARVFAIAIRSNPILILMGKAWSLSLVLGTLGSPLF